MDNNSLASFLEKKTLYYDKIDYDVIYKSWEILEKHIKLPYVIHIVGTNGKGTTGRFLASFLNQLEKSVVHYSSPHVIKFNERIWIDGADCSDKQLDTAHKKLQNILPTPIVKKLTYFEYTTLLALYLSDKLDYIVLEAGLGGEFDATNVVKNDLSLFTTFSLDHQSFLGDTIEKITTTKMKSCNNSFILGKQVYPEVYDIKNSLLTKFTEIEYKKDIQLPPSSKNLPSYLIDNLKLSLSCLDYLGLSSKSLKVSPLKGRFEKISDNIIIDVGHNPLAAKAIYNELLKEDKKVILVYNSFKDKDYEEVLNILKPM
ncbi:MAG: bifunctional folylpolyglutamate synthase/dihydrofolate synthase, partial [Campylobacterota bacterium]|nr:bifunctional folylpolyglutamate synthase/dihydrofolate synthase [Campylobacterota bacterium]